MPYRTSQYLLFKMLIIIAQIFLFQLQFQDRFIVWDALLAYRVQVRPPDGSYHHYKIR